jgi:hypothetical protein
MNTRDIPNPAEFGYRAPHWSKAFAEYRRLVRERTETLAMQGELRTRMGQAQDADSTAYANALRTGKADPGTPQVDAVRAEMESVARRAAALEIAVRQAESELAAAVETERAAVLAEVESDEAARRATLQAAVEALNEARTAHAEALALRGYLSQWPDGRFKIAGGYLRVDRAGDGAPPPLWSTVLEQLRQDAAEPVVAEPPNYAQPLQPREFAFGVSGTPPRD